MFVFEFVLEVLISGEKNKQKSKQSAIFDSHSSARVNSYYVMVSRWF